MATVHTSYPPVGTVCLTVCRTSGHTCSETLHHRWTVYLDLRVHTCSLHWAAQLTAASALSTSQWRKSLKLKCARTVADARRQRGGSCHLLFAQHLTHKRSVYCSRLLILYSCTLWSLSRFSWWSATATEPDWCLQLNVPTTVHQFHLFLSTCLSLSIDPSSAEPKLASQCLDCVSAFQFDFQHSFVLFELNCHWLIFDFCSACRQKLHCLSSLSSWTTLKWVLQVSVSFSSLQGSLSFFVTIIAHIN